MSKWFVALSLLLLAGCSSPPEAMGTSSSTTTEPVAMAPIVEAKPLPPLVGECSITRTNVGTPFGLGLYVDRGLPGFQECHFDDLFVGDLTTYGSGLVEATWTSQATETGVTAWVESADCASAPTVPCDAPFTTATTSPLRLAIPGLYLQQHGASDVQVQVAGEGLAIQQAFHVYITLFPQGEPPMEYTAIPA
ncbi:MAG: hypothetical protein WC876_10955 [Candidatus Thermoplasmatota archaeon]|jgi:hypothetical protein